MKRFTLRSERRGQTLLEYILMLTVVIVPTALAIRDLMSDSEEGAKDSFQRQIVSESYGDGNRMGIIGRPYP